MYTTMGERKQRTMVQMNYYLNFLKLYLCIRPNSQNLKQMHSVKLVYLIMLNVILWAFSWSQEVGGTWYWLRYASTAVLWKGSKEMDKPSSGQRKGSLALSSWWTKISLQALGWVGQPLLLAWRLFVTGFVLCPQPVRCDYHSFHKTNKTHTCWEFYLFLLQWYFFF